MINRKKIEVFMEITKQPAVSSLNRESSCLSLYIHTLKNPECHYDLTIKP